MFYFSVAIDSGEIPASVWQEEGNFEVRKRYYIQIRSISFLTLVLEKLFKNFNVCEI